MQVYHEGSSQLMSLCGDSTLASTDVPIDGPERIDYLAGVNWQWGDLNHSYSRVCV